MNGMLDNPSLISIIYQIQLGMINNGVSPNMVQWFGWFGVEVGGFAPLFSHAQTGRIHCKQFMVISIDGWIDR